MEEAIKNTEPPMKETAVFQETVDAAEKTLKLFHCKLGWNPKHSDRCYSYGRDCKQEEECARYLDAYWVLKKVKDGILAVVHEERAWEL